VPAEAHYGKAAPSWQALDSAPWLDTLVFRVRKPVRWPQSDDRENAKRFKAPFYYLALPPKVLLRAEGLVSVGMGNHLGKYETTPRRVRCDIDIYHYPIRSRERFELSVRRFGEALTDNPHTPPAAGWQYRRWLKTYNQTGTIDAALREALPGQRGMVFDQFFRRIVKDTRMRDEIKALVQRNEKS
jgi:hypothetical protein